MQRVSTPNPHAEWGGHAVLFKEDNINNAVSNRKHLLEK